MRKRALQLSVVLVFSAATPAWSQTFTETVNYIFHGSKQISNGAYATIFRSELYDYNESACTVKVRAGPYIREGTIHLTEVARWSWRPVLEAGQVVGVLRLIGDGEIFVGRYWVNRVRQSAGCTGECYFYTPNLDVLRLSAAFDHLWTNYCVPSKLKTPF